MSCLGVRGQVLFGGESGKVERVKESGKKSFNQGVSEGGTERRGRRGRRGGSGKE